MGHPLTPVWPKLRRLARDGNRDMGVYDRVEISPDDTFNTQSYTRATRISYYYNHLLSLPNGVPLTRYHSYNPFTAAWVKLPVEGEKHVE